MRTLTYTGHETNEQSFNAVVPVAQECAVSAFCDVVPQWQHHTTTSGSISACRYASQGGQASYTRNTKIQKPSASDFIADVEITARRVLTPLELDHFRKVYFVDMLPIADSKDEDDEDENGQDKYLSAYLNNRFRHTRSREIFLEVDIAIRRKLGEAFKQAEIHPVPGYFESRDVRMVNAIDVVVHEDGSRAVYEIKEERY